MATAVVWTLIGGPAGAASPYEWDLECAGQGESTATWQWLNNGTAIEGASETASCGGYGGSGGITQNRPDGANGIKATLSVQSCGKEQSKTASKAFAVDGSFTLSLKVTVQSTKVCRDAGWSEAGATFTVVG